MGIRRLCVEVFMPWGFSIDNAWYVGSWRSGYMSINIGFGC